MNRFAKMKKERIYTLFETLSMKKERIYTLFETLSKKTVLFILLLNTYHCNKNSCHDRNVHQ